MVRVQHICDDTDAPYVHSLVVGVAAKNLRGYRENVKLENKASPAGCALRTHVVGCAAARLQLLLAKVLAEAKVCDLHKVLAPIHKQKILRL